MRKVCSIVTAFVMAATIFVVPYFSSVSYAEDENGEGYDVTKTAGELADGNEADENGVVVMEGEEEQAPGEDGLILEEEPGEVDLESVP